MVDTEKYILIDDNLDKELDGVKYIGSLDDRVHYIMDYIEITRHLQEIYQWFDIFNYNLQCIKESVDHHNSIAINSNMISLLSAGKNLVDSLEICMKNNNVEKYDEFKRQCLSKEYDSCFSYRFLIKLRNFTQHSHIPISCLENDICLDLRQIYNTPHYNFNEKLKKEVYVLMKEIESNNENSLLSLPLTVISYVQSVYRIYKRFLSIIRLELIDKRKKCYKIFEDSPELISNDKYNGFVFYQLSEDNKGLHTFNINDDPEGLLIQRKNEVIDCLNQENETMKRLSKHLVPIKLNI